MPVPFRPEILGFNTLGGYGSGDQDPRPYIRNILDQNKNLNFVQRAINPTIYPNIQLNNKDHATHQLSFANDERGRAIVYPEIIQNREGALEHLGKKEALDYARQTKQFIPFNTIGEADFFSKNYKSIWNQK